MYRTRSSPLCGSDAIFPCHWHETRSTEKKKGTTFLFPPVEKDPCSLYQKGKTIEREKVGRPFRFGGLGWGRGRAAPNGSVDAFPSCHIIRVPIAYFTTRLLAATTRQYRTFFFFVRDCPTTLILISKKSYRPRLVVEVKNFHTRTRTLTRDLIKKKMCFSY